MSAKQIEKTKLLIGEGMEDKRFLESLVKNLGLEDIQVEEYGGKKNLNKYIKSLPVFPGFKNLVSLGITRDADDSIESTQQSIASIVESFQKNIDKNLLITFFILPDNKSPGMLEDLCLKSVCDREEYGCIETYLQCVLESCNRQPNNLSKAKLQMWLASQKEAGKRLAEAAEAGYWDWNHPAFDSIKEFLIKL